MYVKNISQILNLKGEPRVNLNKDSFVSGKILTLSQGKGVVQLNNGTMLPSVFIMDENLQENKNYRFQVKDYSEDKIVLKVIPNNEVKESTPTDISKIVEKLNLPKDVGQDIISKLIKFSVPAKDENILNIFNNYNFIKEVRTLSNQDLLNLLNNLSSSNFTENSKEFIAFKNMLSVFNNIDLDFLSLLEQNNIPATLDNINKMKDFIDKPLTINNFINDVSNSNLTKSLTSGLDATSLETLSAKHNIPLYSLKAILSYIDDNNVDLYNMSPKNAGDIKSLIGQSDNLKIFNVLMSSLKNINLLINLNSKDESTMDTLIKSLSNNLGITPEKSSLINVSIALKENPTLTNMLLNSDISNKDLLNLTQKIMKNPMLTEFSDEFTILKEVNKGALQDILSVKYTRTDKLENLIIKSLTGFIGSKEPISGNVQNLSNAINILKDNPDIMSKLSNGSFLPLSENLDINKMLSLNYTMLNFNFLDKQNLYKNNIIIKNKHSAKYIDINDVKLYISVESTNLGLIEGYVSKKFNDISINLKANDNAIKPIKNKLFRLENKLKDMGYTIINISIDPSKESSDILSLSSFFSDRTYTDLDVKA
ncbi:MAG: hypothetical protein RR789_02085 [Clostridium sp.]